MIAAYYESVFLLSVLFTLLYAVMWNKHFDIHFTLIFIFVPISELGYFMLVSAEDKGAALAANKLIYIGGCFLMLFIMLSVFHLCRIKLKSYVQAFFVVFSLLVYMSVLTIGRGKIFYKTVQFKQEDGAGMLYDKTYGFMHTVFMLMVLSYSLLSISAIAYTFFKKKDVSRRLMFLLFLPEATAVCCYFTMKAVGAKLDFQPAVYLFAQFVYLIIVQRKCLYDIDDSVVDSLVQNGDTAIISIDFTYNYLGCNETAKKFFPALNTLLVDKSIDQNSEVNEPIMKWLSEFINDPSKNKFYYELGDNIYLVNVRHLYNGGRIRGYQFIVTDDTKNQKYIELIDRYNTDLKREIAEKTNYIIDLSNNLVMGLAMIVESRDNSTGGHIKRTRQTVRLLTLEMMKDKAFDLSDEYYRDIIKAAPMHDLGKIAVDDAVLRKPGRFTDEEYAKMKIHAAEGARIVHSILSGDNDAQFVRIAENMAHYHHERWDGSGYPDGLKGDEIPIEARIMAIADVYDALVSKRVYKEKMSFAQADKIIIESMGKHFDSRLEKYYILAKPRLESYYSQLGENES